MTEPYQSSPRIEQLDAISVLLEAKLQALDALPMPEAQSRAAEPIPDTTTHALPTNAARELVESVERDLTSLAQHWAEWRGQLQQWEASQTEA